MSAKQDEPMDDRSQSQAGDLEEEWMDDPDFIEPKSGPLQGVLEHDTFGRFIGVRPLTPKEAADDDLLRASRPARLAALKARLKEDRKKK